MSVSRRELMVGMTAMAVLLGQDLDGGWVPLTAAKVRRLPLFAAGLFPLQEGDAARFVAVNEAHVPRGLDSGGRPVVMRVRRVGSLLVERQLGVLLDDDVRVWPEYSA